METLVTVLLIGTFGATPALLYLGLLRGLRSMQDSSAIQLAEMESGTTAKEVTLGDAVRGVLYGQEDYTERDKYQ